MLRFGIRIIELDRLENTFKIIKSKCKPNASMSTTRLSLSTTSTRNKLKPLPPRNVVMEDPVVVSQEGRMGRVILFPAIPYTKTHPNLVVNKDGSAVFLGKQERWEAVRHRLFSVVQEHYLLQYHGVGCE